MSAHTPGPWTVHHRMRDCVTFEGRHGTENLFLENVDGYYACQNEADARLIAAAPDLLAALDHPMLRQLFGDIEDSGTPEAQKLWAHAMAWFDVRDAAIAKATGAA